MANNTTKDLKDLFQSGKNWIVAEIDCLKLTAAEKLSVLISTIILLMVLFIVGLVVLIVFAFALIDLFALFMPHALACVTVGGIFLLLVLTLYLLRNPLIISPITRLITKLFLTKKQ